MPKKKNPAKLPYPTDNSRKGRRPGTTTSTGEKNPRPAKPGKPWVPARLGPKDGVPAARHEPSVFKPAKSSGASSSPKENQKALRDASSGNPVRGRAKK